MLYEVLHPILLIKLVKHSSNDDLREKINFIPLIHTYISDLFFILFFH